MSEKKTEGNKSSELKGLRIRTFSLWMVIGTMVVSALIGNGIFNLMKRYRNLAEMTKEYILTQKDVMDMSIGSDFLTEQTQLYVISKDIRYAQAYFKEADVTRRRDKALEGIEELLQGKDETALNLSKEAMKLSDGLMDLEIRAMKLAALSVKKDVNALSPRMQECELTEQEQNLSAREKSEQAMQLVFGQEYRDMKLQVEDRLTDVVQHVTKVCDEAQEESEREMKNALIHQCIYTVLVVLLVILSYVMIAVLILRPIRIYINCIKNNNFLEITGAYEFKYLAVTYNNVYEMSLAQQNTLRRKAERDALTGLLNRQAFEQLKTRFSNSKTPLVFLLIDVDVFKSINDTYGHEVGDKALVHVAGLLKESFRSSDHVMRIGGDEFAVIIEKMQGDKKIIADKIDTINWTLQHPQKDMPEFSISVGIAFSDSGYQDDLFRQADKALYRTKENGRCGYTFYEP